MMTRTMLQKIRDSLSLKPLSSEEMLRVEGLGSLFVSLIPKETGKEGFRWMYTLSINGVRYFFYTEVQEEDSVN